jgi:hypothetical protein
MFVNPARILNYKSYKDSGPIPFGRGFNVASSAAAGEVLFR